jgi:hypothetical protein
MPGASISLFRHHAERRGRSRRTRADPSYLKPIFGCLRCNRRGVFAAALTRYLKPVYAAEPVGTRDFLRRQILGAQPRKVTRELAGEQLAPALSPPGTCACNHRTPGRRWQAVPERRAACGPSTGSGAAAVLFQTRNPLRGATKLVSVYEVGGERGTLSGRSRGDMSTPQKRPPTRHFLLTTSDNSRSVPLRRGPPGLLRACIKNVRCISRRPCSLNGEYGSGPRVSGAGPYQPGLVGEDHGLDAVAEAEFGQDPFQVGFDR